MSTIFSRIIAGELPARFVWADDQAVAFLTVAPRTEGHTLVVPRAEIDQWTDAPADLLSHLTTVAQSIGQSQIRAFGSERAGLEIAGFEVPHLHIHVWPVNSIADFAQERAQHNPDPAALDAHAERLREQLRADGCGHYVSQAKKSLG